MNTWVINKFTNKLYFAEKNEKTLLVHVDGIPIEFPIDTLTILFTEVDASKVEVINE